MADKVVQIGGACHCKNVTFHIDVLQGSEVVALDCNCSVCRLKHNIHTITSAANFHLDPVNSPLTKYTFNTKTAQHLFCPVCGVQAFYIPRSHPESYAVTVACLDEADMLRCGVSVRVQQFDGANWEASFKALNDAKTLPER